MSGPALASCRGVQVLRVMVGGSSVTFPVAVLDGELVWAVELARAGSRPEGLGCVGCGSRMVLRAGERRAVHFAHFDVDRCPSAETALHRAAKEVIAVAVRAERARGGRYPDSTFW